MSCWRRRAALELGTDVPGRVAFRQGGSAATTARWLARLGVPTTFVCAVGRDAAGRALVERVAAERVHVRAIRVARRADRTHRRRSWRRTASGRSWPTAGRPID
jgi:sugar/nucleoside kinase (ribokinase family)